MAHDAATLKCAKATTSFLLPKSRELDILPSSNSLLPVIGVPWSSTWLHASTDYKASNQTTGNTSNSIMQLAVIQL